MAKSIQMKNQNGDDIYPYALLKEFVLYNNDSGATSNITLSDSVANYTYIEIFARNESNKYISVKAYNPNNKNVTLLICSPYSNSYQGLYMADIYITGNSIKYLYYSQGNIRTSNSLSNWSSGSGVGQVYITRVVGYK